MDVLAWVNGVMFILGCILLLLLLMLILLRKPRGHRLRAALVYAGSVAAIYGIVILALVLLEHKLVFPRYSAEDYWRVPVGLPLEEITWPIVLNGNQESIHGWWIPKENAKWTVLFSHGNAGNISIHLTVGMIYHKVGCNLLIYDYAGYGKSTGNPCEEGCTSAGLAAYEWLINTKGIRSENLILLGDSLGGAIAIDIATKKPHKLLATYQSFTSLPDVASYQLPYIPCQWLCKTRLNSLEKLKRIDGPVILGHGKLDQLIPCDHSQKLHDACPSSNKRLFFYDQYGHGEHALEFCSEVIRMADEIK